MKKIVDEKFIKFLIVGGLNTLVGYSFFAFFVFLGLHFPLAVLCSTVLGILINFKTIGSLVFSNRKNSLFLKFVGVYAVVYLFNVIFIAILKHFNLNTYFAGGVMILPMALFAFVLNKKFVFIERTE